MNNENTARPPDTLPVGAWPSQIHSFELGPKTHFRGFLQIFRLKICVSQNYENFALTFLLTS